MNTAGAEGEQRVLLLPATRRDGEAIAAFLSRHQILCHVCHTVTEAAQAVTDHAGVLVLSEQVVTDPQSSRIATALARQPTWSDLPVILLSKVGTESLELSDLVGRMTNVTLLDRPASTRTLLSTVQAALRSRSKQYQMRDQLSALQTAENALRHSDRRKDEFLAMLAHELRNPLAPIRNAVDLLRRLIAAGDSRVSATLEVVNRQVKQLTRLVDDLLDVSRITQGRIEIKRATVELSDIVTQALESVQPMMSDKRHSVVCSVAPGIFVEGDSARLVQCVSNILINAAKYTDPGGSISVDLAGDAHQAILSVCDSGIGIPGDLLPRVFELFVQDVRSLDRSQGGLGIGLSVVRKLVEMHGGEVSALSYGAGQGSTFKIVLPRVPAPPRPKIADMPTEAGAALKVLVVDDNQDAADSLAMLLSLEGHAVEAVYDPHEAVAITPIFSPHVVFLDIGLPEMNGYEVARRLRDAGIRAHLVALTGYGQHEDIARAMRAGFDKHLVKPVDLDKLKAVLRGVEPSANAS
jgi:signal transduction histidine kinase/ActR/RegA family two-component response regulator